MQNRTAPAMSSTVPIRRAGLLSVNPRNRLALPSAPSPSQAPVSIVPGEMALTRTGANSTASDRASVSAAPLVIAIGDRIVRALRERPCMLHRFPSGVDGDKVHQKRVPSGSLQPPVADQPLQRCTSTASTAPVARCWG
jgi:LigD, primase-polymerase domain